MIQYLAVFIGGGIGSIARFGISKWVNNTFTLQLPLATFISNVISCFILAGIMLLSNVKMPFSHNLKLMLAVGICGGLSTFSTFSFETFELFKNGYILIASLNIFISISTCLGVIYLMYR